MLTHYLFKINSFKCFFLTDCTNITELSPMETFKDHTATINLKFLKQCGFYQIFDPNSKKIFGWNVYQLSFIVLIGISECLMCFGNCGFLFELEDTINNIDLFLVIFSNFMHYSNVLKLVILIFNRKKILDLFKVTDLMFLKSKHCRDNIQVLYKHRNRNLKLTNSYFYLGIIIIFQWFIFPIIINSFIAYKNDNQRKENIINRQYPVDINTFNKYYFLFYIFEFIIAMKSIYLIMMIDILLLSIGWAIIVQYEVLAVAFKNVGYNENLLKGENTF